MCIEQSTNSPYSFQKGTNLPFVESCVPHLKLTSTKWGYDRHTFTLQRVRSITSPCWLIPSSMRGKLNYTFWIKKPQLNQATGSPCLCECNISASVIIFENEMTHNDYIDTFPQFELPCHWHKLVDTLLTFRNVKVHLGTNVWHQPRWGHAHQNCDIVPILAGRGMVSG